MKRVLLAGILLALSFAASAQGYPSRPVKIIVPAGTGGPDIVARVVAAELQAQLGQPFVVENRPGANGIVGTDVVAKSAPDGHTLLVYSPGFVVNKFMHKSLPYDTERDFAPVTNLVSSGGLFLAVNPSIPANTIQEFIAYAKKPGTKLAYSTPGIANNWHLATEVFSQKIGISMTHVPYKGGGPAMQDLIAGHVPVITPILSSAVLAQHRAGKARILGVNTDRRLKAAPELPTSIEGGVPDMRVQVFNAVFAPAGTPAQAIDVLRRATVKMRSDPAFIADIEKAGAELFAQEDEDKFVRDEAARWTRVIRDIGFELR